MTQTQKTKATRSAILAVTLSAMALTGLTSVAQAAAPGTPVVGCAATGSKQEKGALIGAAIGAVLGNNLAKNDQGTGTAVGAVVGAGAGSMIGCQMQKGDERRAAPAVHTSAGLMLAPSVRAVRLDRADVQMVSRANVSVRSGPGTGYNRIGSLASGQSFQALGYADSGRWVLVGRNGVGIGYVSSAYVSRSGGYQHTAW